MLAALHRPLASLRRIRALLVFALVFDTGIALAKQNHGGSRHGGAEHGGTTAGHGRGGYGPKTANHRHGARGGFGGPNAGFVCEPNSAWYDPESCRHRDE